MARKEDKLRPYRVDYFDIEEMRDNDLALIRSEIVRAVTSNEAISRVCETRHTPDNRVVIRSYRFYKNLVHKKDVYKAIEDLFSANEAVKVMERVEAYRAKFNAPLAVPETGATSQHVTRMSDSSLYDEVCVNCGATDASGKLNQPCPSALMTPVPQPPVLTLEQAKTGPDSPATKAVVADMQGMIDHDAHEQAMDKFVPDVPEGKRFPDPTNTPITTPPVLEFSGYNYPSEPPIEPDQAVGADARPRVPHWSDCSCAVCAPLTEIPLYIKVLMFSAALALVIGVILHFCH